MIFLCFHPRLTFPQTRNRLTYCVCLKCGREFLYDWERMALGPEILPKERATCLSKSIPADQRA